jgi:hypothetical protein
MGRDYGPGRAAAYRQAVTPRKPTVYAIFHNIHYAHVRVQQFLPVV